uniref:Uncharacterized protein n=1 Tax=Heterorhabditis bacteriophora TaxID=37862 RepID=A0A1I7XF80_HETBA
MGLSHSEESRRALAASKPVTCFEMGVWRIEEHTWNERGVHRTNGQMIGHAVITPH